MLGIALGIPLNRASTGPFAQFQNCTDDLESLTGLLMQLLRRVPGSDPAHDAVQMLVGIFKSEADEILQRLADADGEEHEPIGGDASVAKLFEEVKVMFEDIPSRVEGRLGDGAYRGRRFNRRLHPGMMMEMAHMTSREVGGATGFLVMASFFREDAPWLYELALEAYRAVRTGDIEQGHEILDAFRRAAEFSLRGPFSEESGPFGRDLFHIAMELSEMLDHNMAAKVPQRRARVKKVPPLATDTA